MDSIRSIVSQKKKRFTQDGYNLDLTYVCPRIIAMAFPAEGTIEKMYRNPIDKVADLIRKKHDTNYFVFNLSGRKYDISKFDNQVYSVDWEDHHSPALHHLFNICKVIKKFHEINIENVAILHCLAGKGRTGTIICCYLLYSGLFKTVEDTLEYYGKKRYSLDYFFRFNAEGLGVNQPCQIRYIQYFYRLLCGEKVYPNPIYLREIIFIKKPKFNMDGGCRPYIRIKDVLTKNEVKMISFLQLYHHKKETHIFQKFADQMQFFTLTIPKQVPLVGDILINCYNIGMLKESKMFRISLNTAFLFEGEMVFTVNDIDPSQVATDERFPPGFQIKVLENVVFKLKIDNVCICTNKTSLEDKCESCLAILKIDKQDENWKIASQILQEYKQPSRQEADKLLFGDSAENDIEEVLNRKGYFSDQKQESQHQENQKQEYNQVDKHQQQEQIQQQLADNYKIQNEVDHQT